MDRPFITFTFCFIFIFHGCIMPGKEKVSKMAKKACRVEPYVDLSDELVSELIKIDSVFDLHKDSLPVNNSIRITAEHISSLNIADNIKKELLESVPMLAKNSINELIFERLSPSIISPRFAINVVDDNNTYYYHIYHYLYLGKDIPKSSVFYPRGDTFHKTKTINNKVTYAIFVHANYGW